jgi:hypothetical protein
VGTHLPRRYNEASFTFATCMVLALCTVGEKETWSGHTLFFTRAPNNGAAGNCQTAPIAQDPKGEKGSMPQSGYGREGRF